MNERIVVIVNSCDHNVGFADMQGRNYVVKKGAKIRVSKVVMQDLIDQPGNRVIFAEGLAKIEGVDMNFLLSAGITEEEALLYLSDAELAKEESIKEVTVEQGLEFGNVVGEVSTTFEKDAELEPEIKEQPAKKKTASSKKPVKKTVAKKTSKEEK